MAEQERDEFGVLKQPGADFAGAVPPEPTKVTTPDEVKALAPGTEFIDPTGTKRVKPFEVHEPHDIGKVPEGATFIDPQGGQHQRMTFEGLDFNTQQMVDFARGNEKQIEAILKGELKGEVKREPGTNEMYVEKDGKRFKPGRGSALQRGVTATGAAAMPALLSIPGMVAGIPGMALGAATGEAYNQMMLTLAGYPADIKSSLKALGSEAALTAGGGMVGGIAGDAISRAVGGARGVTDTVKGASSWLAKLLGAQPAETETAGRLAGQGVMVPPSAWLKEAPYLRKLVETFDPEFRRQNVLQQSAKAYYDKQAPSILERMGVKPPATLTEATAPVSVEPFGAAMIAKAQAKLAAKDEALNTAIEAARAQLASKGGDPTARAATLAALQKAEAEARQAAQDVVTNGFKAIQADVDNAIKVAQAGENPGDMVRLWNDKVRALRKSVAARATKMYDTADIAAGEIRPDVTALKAELQDFLAQVPEDFKGRYPAIIKQIADMEGGATFGQLHHLRSMLRQDIDYADLTPGVRAGSLKNVVNKINDVLFDKGAPEPLREAATLLKAADNFYSENIPKFKAESMKWLTQQLEAGVPADATALARQFLQPGQTEEIRMLREAGGAPLWSAVQAADTQAMLNQSRTLIPGETDGMRFAEQVLQRERDGILTAAYDAKTAATLRDQAQRVLMLNGKLPIEARPGDTVSNLMRRADDIATEIKAQVEADPIKLLNKELQRFEAEVRKVRAQYQRQRRSDPLAFLGNQNVGAIEAANRILTKPDMIIHVARQFGEKSPEFEMLRQVWATRLFQRSIGDTGKLAGEFAEKIPPEVQTLLFPGVTLDAAQQLAKDMQFLMPAIEPDTGGSMAAASRVLHPMPRLPFDLQRLAEKIPGANTAARAVRGKYYSVMTWAVTHPTFVRYIAAGLKGNPQMRDLARREFMRSYGEWARNAGMATGGELGAVSRPDIEQELQAQPEAAPPPQQNWRERYQQQFGRAP